MIVEYQAYKFILTLLEEGYLPEYKGSTLRGGFGHAFKKVVCLFRNKNCLDCRLGNTCAYRYVFETMPCSQASLFKKTKYEAVPHPFILEPPETEQTYFARGEEIQFSLILIGKGIKFLPYFVMAFEKLGEIGIGKRKSKFMIKKIMSEDNVIYEKKKKELQVGHRKKIFIPERYEFDNKEKIDLTIQFLTPARIKHGRDLVVNLEFFVLITSLLRRTMLLSYFHSGEILPVWDHRAIIKIAKNVIIKENKTKWQDWERYSNRQQTRMKLGGIIGNITYRGELKPFFPLLQAGEILHVGKATSFGLGKYKLINI